MITIVGAGAAGLVAAIFARAGGQPVTVLESTPDGGRKILISGGGRCNVLPAALEPRRFVSDSPAALVQRMLRSWPLKAQLEFFEREAGIPLAFEESSRKWFPASNRARDVRDGLLALARRKGVHFEFNTELREAASVEDGSENRWALATNRGSFDARAVVLATGGLSVPLTGSTGIGLRIAQALGHTVHETYPALTPLLSSPAPHAHLSGISLDVRIRARSERLAAEAHGGFLFTHGGYSGPSVLDVSHVAVRAASNGAAALSICWSELGADAWHRKFVEDARAQPGGLLVTTVARLVPQRLAEQLIRESAIPADRRLADLRREERTALVSRLTEYELKWTGDAGYKKAEVAGGGVALDEVDPRTLESRRVPGLYLCGEILDAFGPIGGHNFAWAWSTGRLVGLALSR